MLDIKYLEQHPTQGSSIKADDIKAITIINEKHTVQLEQKMEIANIFFKQLAAGVGLLCGFIPEIQQSSIFIKLRANFLFGGRPNPTK